MSNPVAYFVDSMIKARSNGDQEKSELFRKVIFNLLESNEAEYLSFVHAIAETNPEVNNFI